MSGKHYNLKKIKQTNADYNLIVGERSNGKSYALKREALELYKKTGKRTVWLRRWADDIVKNKVYTMFSAHHDNGVFEEIFADEYENVDYKNHGFYLCKYDENNQKWNDDTQPFMRVMCLSNWEHDKDTVFNNIGMIVFDEFITRGFYMVNEFVIFCNVLSTLIREKDGIKIYMLGNNVSKNCPYFREMGLNKIYKQAQGTIDIYTMNNLKIAVEICGNKVSKKSDKYFAFNNPALKMITSGKWELEMYQHCPYKINYNDIQCSFVVSVQNTLIQGDCVSSENGKYIYMHAKTTPLKQNTLLYSSQCVNTVNERQNINNPVTPLQKAILQTIQNGFIYYQDNTIGELFNDYLKECRKR